MSAANEDQESVHNQQRALEDESSGQSEVPSSSFEGDIEDNSDEEDKEPISFNNNNDSEDSHHCTKPSREAAGDKPSNIGLHPSDATASVVSARSTLLKPSSLSCILKPSLLDFSVKSVSAGSAETSAMILKPPRLNISSDSSQRLQKEPETAHATQTHMIPSFVPLTDSNLNKTDNVSCTNAFSQLGSSEVEKNSKEKQNFVFGSNLDQRVIINDEKVQPSTSQLPAKRKIEENSKPEYSVRTGEEGEVNILQMYCKLYLFDTSTSSWVERTSNGQLRLNDATATSSRIIVRTSGSLRVVLNSVLYDGMKIEKPSDKSLRLTAFNDDGEIKIYLVMSTKQEIDRLHGALWCRIKKLKMKNESKTNISHGEKEESSTETSAKKLKY